MPRHIGHLKQPSTSRDFARTKALSSFSFSTFQNTFVSKYNVRYIYLNCDVATRDSGAGCRNSRWASTRRRSSASRRLRPPRCLLRYIQIVSLNDEEKMRYTQGRHSAVGSRITVLYKISVQGFARPSTACRFRDTTKIQWNGTKTRPQVKLNSKKSLCYGSRRYKKVRNKDGTILGFLGERKHLHP